DAFEESSRQDLARDGEDSALRFEPGRDCEPGLIKRMRYVHRLFVLGRGIDRHDDVDAGVVRLKQLGDGILTNRIREVKFFCDTLPDVDADSCPRPIRILDHEWRDWMGADDEWLFRRLGRFELARGESWKRG